MVGRSVNLAMRALFDADPEGSASMAEAYQFFIGRSYDDKRPLQGDVAEARVWSKVRTAKEIWDNMYDVDPQSDGLLGYWKFDTPEDGDVVKDITGHGNDSVAGQAAEMEYLGRGSAAEQGVTLNAGKHEKIK